MQRKERVREGPGRRVCWGVRSVRERSALQQQKMAEKLYVQVKQRPPQKKRGTVTRQMRIGLVE